MVRHEKMKSYYYILGMLAVLIGLLTVHYAAKSQVHKASCYQYEQTKNFEGLHRVLPNGNIASYPDVSHGWRVPTIGYGTTEGVYRGMVITKLEAGLFFERDAKKYERYVYMRIGRKLNQCQFDALFDHAYNVGSIYGNLYKNVMAGNDRLAAMWLSRYVYAGGRRLAGLVTRANYRAGRYLECENMPY